MEGSWLGNLFYLFLVFVLVFLNGFFVATEFALVKVRESRITQLEAEGNRRAGLVHKLIDNLDTILSACQLGITLASLGLGWIGEPAVARMLHPWFVRLGIGEPWTETISFVLAFSFITFLHIVLGELAPKSLAIQRAESLSLYVARPIHLFNRVMYPFIAFLNWTAARFLTLLGIRPVAEHEAAHTEEEIRILVSESHKSGLIDQTELMLVDNIFDFSETMAREIMVPRTDMVVLNTRHSIEENVAVIRNSRFTRYPVVDGDKDHVVGILHIKDLLTTLLHNKPSPLEKLIRPVLTVPETISISRLFGMMQKNRGQMAILIDEYGGTAGLVTVEDITEEIVGDIWDEFDDERPEVEKKDGVVSFDGKVLLEEVNDYLNTDLDDSEVDTIAGWIYMQIDHPPKKGDRVTADGYEFVVEEVDNVRITRVQARRLEGRQPDGDA